MTATVQENLFDHLVSRESKGAKAPTKLQLSRELGVREGQVGAALVRLRLKGWIKSHFTERKTSKRKKLRSVSRYSLTPKGKMIGNMKHS